MRNITTADIMTVLSTVGGVLGVIFGATNLGSLTTPVDTAITSIGGVITAISAWHAHKIVAQRAVNTIPQNPPRTVTTNTQKAA